MDYRHEKRIKIVQELYSLLFNIPKNQNKNNISKKTLEVFKHKNEIDELFKKYATKFSIENTAKVDLAILYLTIFELIYEKKEPPKVIIDEGIELAKEMGGKRSYAFVNAILGKIYQEKIALSKT